jgi:hypothetical protein
MDYYILNDMVKLLNSKPIELWSQGPHIIGNQIGSDSNL